MLARHELEYELDKTSLNLLAAADKLDKEGHAKGLRQTSRGYCALGAIGAVIYDNPWIDLYDDATVLRLAAHLPQPTYDGWSIEHKVAQWNNEPERTAEEVIDKFREVAYDPQYAKVTV